MALLFLFFSLLAAGAYTAELFVIEAGVTAPTKQLLQDNFAVCPSTFSPNGISIECVTLFKPYGKFSVNGAPETTERSSPYTIAGDMAGVANKWNPPAGMVNITCNDISLVGSFDCGAVSPTETSPKLVMREAGEINLKSRVLDDGFSICPTTFSTKGIAVECVDPTASLAKFTVNGMLKRTETWPPYSINGDTDSMLNAWNPPPGTVTILCTTNLGSTAITGTFACANDFAGSA